MKISKPQIQALKLAAKGKDFSGEVHSATSNALVRKGFIERLGCGYFYLTENGMSQLHKITRKE